MKLWRFYKKPSKDFDKEFSNIHYDHNDLSLKYPLLAITNNKKMAKEYMYTRKKENILCICESEFKEEILDYMKENRGYVLSYKTLRRFKNNHSDVEDCVEALTYELKVLMTENEENYLLELLDSGTILEHIFQSYMIINPLYFSNKIKDLLKQVGYIDCYALYHQDMTVYKGYGDLGEYYPNIDFTLDEFFVFLYINKENLNIENLLSIL